MFLESLEGFSPTYSYWDDHQRIVCVCVFKGLFLVVQGGWLFNYFAFVVYAAFGGFFGFGFSHPLHYLFLSGRWLLRLFVGLGGCFGFGFRILCFPNSSPAGGSLGFCSLSLALFGFGLSITRSSGAHVSTCIYVPVGRRPQAPPQWYGSMQGGRVPPPHRGGALCGGLLQCARDVVGAFAALFV